MSKRSPTEYTLAKGFLMLILSRQTNEVVVIDVPGGYRIRVMLVSVRSMNKVRLGFDAAPDVAINREEIAEKIAAQARAEDTKP